MGLFFLAGLFLAGPGMALDPQRRVSQYSLDMWGSDDGLPQNSPLALAQTQDGYLWLGTWEGLVRFDGARFSVFDKLSTPALRNHIIKALAEDDSGVLWVGTDQGLVAYRDGNFERAPGAASPLDGVRVQELVVVDDWLWVGTSGGLWRVPLGGGTARHFTEANGLPHPHVSALVRGEGSSLWVGTKQGLVLWANGQLEPAPFPFPGLDSRPEVLALSRSAEGVLWVGTNAGLFSWNGVVARRYGPEDGLKSTYITTLYTDHDGNLWVGSRHGGLVRRGADGGFSGLVPGPGLVDAEVLSVLEDRDRHLWVGTTSGLFRLQDGAFATWGGLEGMDHEVITVLEDQRGTVWLGTVGGGLHRLEGGRLKKVGAAEGLPEKVISGLAESRDGTLWVGTTHGVYRYDGGRFSPFGRGQGMPQGTVTALRVDSRGDTWVASPKELARLRAGGAITVYGERQGVTHPIVAMEEDALGRMWFATEAGVLRWEEGKGFQRFTQKDGLPNDVVLSLLADADGTVWVGTELGLGRWRNGTWARFTMEQGLYDDAVFGLVPDGDGNLWMSSNKGVSRVPRRELEEVAAGTLPRVTVLSFDTRDGMRSAECNGNTQPSAWRGRDGRLWFTNLRGAVVVDPVRVRATRRPPEVRIEEVRVQGQRVPVTDRVELPPGRSRLDIRFTAFTAMDAKRLSFRYRLKNHDDIWVRSEGRTATYTGLRPGRYTFEVQAEGRDGGWTVPVALSVGVEPKLWQQTWFVLLCVLGSAGLGVSVYWLRVGQLKKRERWLAERVRERTQELARANQDLETNMRTLRQTQAQLVQAGRMAAVGQLAAGVGHEINNPLAYIVSNLEHACGEAEALARELGEVQGAGPRLREVSQALRDALHGADRVRRIVRDLKTFSRPDDESQGPVELHAVLDSAVKIAMGELRPRAKLVRDYGDVPLVEGNEARLAQVFLNLLINAAQALPEGRSEENEVRLVTRVAPDGHVFAEVRDTGSGISPEALGRIFDPFFTTKPVGVGTGLGLSLCHAYVTAMGGTISVESEPGRGAVFRVTLRRAKGAPVAAPQPWRERSSGAFATVKPAEAPQRGGTQEAGEAALRAKPASEPAAGAVAPSPGAESPAARAARASTVAPGAGGVGPHAGSGAVAGLHSVPMAVGAAGLHAGSVAAAVSGAGLHSSPAAAAAGPHTGPEGRAEPHFGSVVPTAGGAGPHADAVPAAVARQHAEPVIPAAGGTGPHFIPVFPPAGGEAPAGARPGAPAPSASSAVQHSAPGASLAGGEAQPGGTHGVAAGAAGLPAPGPAAPEAEAPRVQGPAPAPQAPARGRVLVVDDDALVSGAIRRTLSRENDVEVLVSARQALERLLLPEPLYDVVLCDLMMPEMTGMDLYEALTRAAPQVADRVVFITGGAFTPAARTFLERVENPRVEKPFDPEALRKLIRAEVARVRALPSGWAA